MAFHLNYRPPRQTINRRPNPSSQFTGAVITLCLLLAIGYAALHTLGGRPF
jgi:hypothetical protein